MATLHILMIGHEGALKHPRAQEIKTQLTKGDLAKVVCVTQPEDIAKLGALRQKFDVWIFVAHGAQVPAYSVWKLHLGRLKDYEPMVAVVSDRVLPSSVVDQFSPKYIALGRESAESFCTKILNFKVTGTKIKDLTNRAATVSQTQMENSPLLSPTNPLDELVAGLDQEVSHEEALKSEVQSNENISGVKQDDLVSLGNFEPGKAPEAQSSGGESLIKAEDLPVSEDAFINLGEKTSVTDQNALSSELQSSDEKFEFMQGVSQASVNFDQLNPPEASLPAKGAHEFETLNRFALLKEREAREREATIQVLNKQLSQLKEKLARSEVERRRLQVAFDEAQVTIRALEEARDQHQNQLRKLDSQHQERQKAIQAKLDNAQFTATRAEKKLEEFKERVRNDILRIRLRERELGNKLELQKRDAEALLTSKDERLLEQKREIDRLEYEMELLKERMIENTARAEERAAKLSRALQSLKMAQGVLTGIEEEVIPTAESMNDDSGQDAA